jgi:Transposase DDE domain
MEEPSRRVRSHSDDCGCTGLRCCTTSAHGRSVHIHPDERLLTELRRRQLTPQGRAKLRERVAVEHALTHAGRRQGPRAHYRGSGKKLLDLGLPCHVNLRLNFTDMPRYSRLLTAPQHRYDVASLAERVD